MPELPEVETIVRGLASRITGLEIAQLEVRLPKQVWLGQERATGQTEVNHVRQLVEGQHCQSITRRGKMIIIELSNDQLLLIHLKMTGQLIYLDVHQRRLAGGHPTGDMAGDMPNKSSHIIFHFSDGSKLFFNDQRQFGYLKVIPAGTLSTHPVYTNYGPEPFDPNLTVDYLMARAARRPRQTMKQFLLDQSIIAGIGNIYADESLFESKIYPGTRIYMIRQAQMEELLHHIRQVIDKGIAYGGTSSQHYVQADGHQGSMQDHLKVYGRAGQPCLVCGTTIERTVIGGRGTHYCPQCQPITLQ